MKNKFVDFKVLATSLCCSVVMGLISFAFLKFQELLSAVLYLFARSRYCDRFCI